MDFTIEGLLIGLLAIAIGAAFAFYGFRVFLILLPIWGFFAGFLLGAGVMDSLFPDAGFLVEVSGCLGRTHRRTRSRPRQPRLDCSR